MEIGLGERPPSHFSQATNIQFYTDHTVESLHK